MDTLPNIEVNEICRQLGMNSPKKIKQIYGGNIHSSWQIEFKNVKFFLKRNERKKKLLKFEEHCLKDMLENINEENLIIPKVYSYFEVKNVELLLIEWINMRNNNQEKLGKGLGEMHLKSNEFAPKKFGYPIEGYIGITNQVKGWADSWIDCFVKLRIDPQISILKDNFSEIKNKINDKIRLELIKHEPLNTLVHGDLWSGNVGIEENGKGVIFDPASWWADSEVDIAMTRLFGGFEREFYEEYHKIIPIKEGFEKRMIIYNFYHILNHANMFGGSYLYQVENYIKKIMNM